MVRSKTIIPSYVDVVIAFGDANGLRVTDLVFPWLASDVPDTFENQMKFAYKSKSLLTRCYTRRV